MLIYKIILAPFFANIFKGGCQSWSQTFYVCFRNPGYMPAWLQHLWSSMSSEFCCDYAAENDNILASLADCTRKKIFWLGVQIFCD